MTSERVLDSTTTREGDTVSTLRCANGKVRMHFDLAPGSSFHRKMRAAAEKAGMPLDQWIASALKAEVARLKALESAPLKVSAKSTAVFATAAKVLGVTPAEVADYLIDSIARDLDDPENGLMTDMARGGHIPLPRKELPAVRERFIRWATARKLSRKRAERDLDEAAA